MEEAPCGGHYQLYNFLVEAGWEVSELVYVIVGNSKLYLTDRLPLEVSAEEEGLLAMSFFTDYN